MASRFKVGDLVREKPGTYNEWSEGLLCGEVVRVEQSLLTIRFIDSKIHRERIGSNWFIYDQYVEKIDKDHKCCFLFPDLIFG